MAQEAERLQKPTYTIDCNNTASHATWSRSELVDRLAQRNAFSVQYDTSGSAPRTDLLNPALSNDTVIRRLGEVTGFGWCNNFNFDVLLVTSGHSENTLGGHRSQHTDGDAFDFRPKNGEVSMPAAALPEGNTLQPENYIVNNPAATAAAVAILGFMDSVPNKYHQVITSDLAGNINEGHVLPGNYDWGAKTESTHLEHIHAGVNPAYQG